MRYHVKGGIWKNTEDEILKAAVMKYGLNQWSRISSLLVRKSAKQCKERWYEWLDPKIKKTEWSKDEEEKLLHLAKMFPCQWRTIAPFVGRTAYQCLEHYEKLLDKAQGRISDENDPRRLRPGEIDPNPEVKPARPDPIDADEDTKETLNEARARVANTRGKKAKRKIREKQLEEARRLAALQKKRELKSAGIEIVLRLPKKKKKEMNYNIDVPFMRHVPLGTWTNELEPTPEPNKFKGGISLQYLENRDRDKEEEKNRKIDEKHMKNLKQKELPVAIDMINKMNDPLNSINRNKLNLPTPQVTEIDLKEISKLTNTSSTLATTMQNYPSTSVLTGDYSQLRDNAMSTIRTPQIENRILTEAKLAVSILEGQTPLIGGEGAKKDLEFYLAHRNIQGFNEFKTPAPVQKDKGNNNQTPYTNLSINSANDKSSLIGNHNKNTMITPVRDEMKINNEESLWESSHIINQNNDSSLIKEGNANKNIRGLFEALPQPKNKYDIEMMDEPEALNKEDKEDNDGDIKMKDAEELNKEKLLQIEQEQKTEEEKYSIVIRKKLPRPHLNNKVILTYINNTTINDNDTTIHLANEMINEEVIRLIKKDSQLFPYKGMPIQEDNEDIDNDNNDNITTEDKELIEEIINEELQNYQGKGYLKFSSSSLLKKSLENSNIIFLPKESIYTHLNPKIKQDKYQKYNEDFAKRTNQLTKEHTFNQKLKSKSEILTHGLIMKYNKLYFEAKAIINEISQLSQQKLIYKQMYNEEQISFIQRKRNKEQYLSELIEYESILQSKYKRLKK